MHEALGILKRVFLRSGHFGTFSGSRADLGEKQCEEQGNSSESIDSPSSEPFGATPDSRRARISRRFFRNDAYFGKSRRVTRCGNVQVGPRRNKARPNRARPPIDSPQQTQANPSRASAALFVPLIHRSLPPSPRSRVSASSTPSILHWFATAAALVILMTTAWR